MIESDQSPDSEGACGLDEVGRGALAGPLVAAAVILAPGFRHPLLRDSKQLSARQREQMDQLIRSAAVRIALVVLPVEMIDRRGVGWANRIAFERLIRTIPAPLHLADGNLRIRAGASYRSVIHGDALIPAIAAASIVAKVFRDQLMRDLAPAFPHYGWAANKGYGTAFHLDALSRHGPCPHHRRSFLGRIQPELPWDGTEGNRSAQGQPVAP